jgi:hypothetical protein
MGLSGEELTPFVGVNNSLDVSYCGGSVETLLKSFADSGPWPCLMSARATVDVV